MNPNKNAEPQSTSENLSQKKEWDTPTCTDLDELKIEGGAGLLPEANGGAVS